MDISIIFINILAFVGIIFVLFLVQTVLLQEIRYRLTFVVLGMFLLFYLFCYYCVKNTNYQDYQDENNKIEIGKRIKITTKDNLIIQGIIKDIKYNTSSVSGGVIGTSGISIGGGDITNSQNGEITIYGHIVGQNTQNSTYIVQLNNYKLIEFLENKKAIDDDKEKSLKDDDKEKSLNKLKSMIVATLIMFILAWIFHFIIIEG